MEQQTFLPKLDNELLQKKANEYAQKGAEDSIRDFYTSYDSPYKKAIRENLINKGIDSAIDIPDIIGILNDSISAEIDLIANNAVSKTFVPMVKDFLTRAKAEITLTEFLTEFVECSGFKYDDDAHIEDYSVEVIKDDGSFKYLQISDSKNTYEVAFYLKSKKDELTKVYETYTLPRVKDTSSSYGYRADKTMKLSIDGVTLEMPFTPKVLEDKFVSYIAKLIIANTKITFDVDDFNDDMFPENECHCD